MSTALEESITRGSGPFAAGSTAVPILRDRGAAEWNVAVLVTDLVGSREQRPRLMMLRKVPRAAPVDMVTVRPCFPHTRLTGTEPILEQT